MLSDVELLRPENAIHVQRFGHLGLQQGTWPLLGRLAGWDRSASPMPTFVRYEELSGRSFRVTYDSDDPNRLVREIEGRAWATRARPEGWHGWGRCCREDPDITTARDLTADLGARCSALAESLAPAVRSGQSARMRWGRSFAFVAAIGLLAGCGHECKEMGCTLRVAPSQRQTRTSGPIACEQIARSGPPAQATLPARNNVRRDRPLQLTRGDTGSSRQHQPPCHPSGLALVAQAASISRTSRFGSSLSYSTGTRPDSSSYRTKVGIGQADRSRPASRPSSGHVPCCRPR